VCNSWSSCRDAIFSQDSQLRSSQKWRAAVEESSLPTLGCGANKSTGCASPKYRPASSLRSGGSLRTHHTGIRAFSIERRVPACAQQLIDLEQSQNCGEAPVQMRPANSSPYVVNVCSRPSIRIQAIQSDCFLERIALSSRTKHILRDCLPWRPT